MKSIFSVFLDIEKLIYKVLMWVILVPKTLVNITLNPAWAPGYVKAEIDSEGPQFDEYISPVILLLIVALIPALAFNFLPTYGAAISSPAETQPTTDRFLSFEARTDFRSSSAEMEYFHNWSVTRVVSAISIESQTDAAPATSGDLTLANEIHYPLGPVNFIEEIDDNTVKDKLLYTFPDAGEYLVVVAAGKYDPRRFDPASGLGVATEIYTSTLRVIVPARLDEQIVISNEEQTKDTEAASPQGFETFTATVQRENTLFLAIALMLPPLLFALATKLFTATIGEDTLKESFYTQCYYFSPLSLAIWASYYARYFFTSDAYFYANENIAIQVIWLPTLLAALWFVRAEVKTIEDARGISGIRSLIVTLVCIVILLLAASAIFRFATLQDDVRVNAIRTFPLLSAALIFGFGVAWYRRRRTRNENMKTSHFLGIGVNAIVLIVLLNFVSARFGTQTQSPVVSRTITPQVSPTALAGTTEEPASSSGIPTQTPTAQITGGENSPTPEGSTVVAESPTPNPFYVEEFNVDPKWLEFMTSGDSSLVERKVELGVLSVQLFKREENTPRFYFVNNAFSYSDVRIEAVATNRGNNSNGVGLICRYSDIGWYEVQVSNSQTFAIYVVDNIGIVNQGYNQVVTGDSKAVQSGLSTNIYSMTCQENIIRLFVNGELLGEYIDTSFGFKDGKIGLSVWSPLTLPVNVDIETLTVSAP